MRLQGMLFEPAVPPIFSGFPFTQFTPYLPGDRSNHNAGQMFPRRNFHSNISSRDSNDTMQGIPDDFWEPVSEEEISLMRNPARYHRDRQYYESPMSGQYGHTRNDGRTRIVPIEIDGEEYINISDDEDCCIVPSGRERENVNNNGKSLRNREVDTDQSDLRTGRKHSTPSKDKIRSSSEKCFEIDTSKRMKNGKSVTPILKTQQSSGSKPLFDSKEEEVQFNELVQFFSDDPSDQSDSTSRSASDFETPPSYPAYNVIRKIISDEGRVIDYVKGDGNCFFRALSKIIYGSESSHEQLRQAVVDFVEKYPRHFEQYVDGGTLQDHIICMRENGAWGTQLEIYAAATLLQRDIYVLSPDHSGKNYRWLLFTPRFSYPEANTYDRCYITLCHTNGNHYDRIASKTGSCNCGREAPVLSGIQTEVDLTEYIPEVV